MAVGFRQRLAALIVTKARRKELLRSRSATLPGRFHPVLVDVAGLHGSVNAVFEWTQALAVCTAWLGAGMDHLGNLLSALTDLLHRPEVQDPERRRRNTASSWTEPLLRDLILLADAHGCFCEVLFSVKQLLDEAQAAVHHLDAARLAAALPVRRRSDHALSHLASTLSALSHRCNSSTVAMSDSGEAALAEAVTAATCAAASASAAIFAALASASTSSASQALTSSPEKAMERLRSLEESVLAAEGGCEQVHRALVNTRMSLLNVLTPC